MSAIAPISALSATPLAAQTDAELAERYQHGDARALDLLLDRYRRFARARARAYFLVGGDADDVEQEALIGLYKAVRDFRPEQASFRSFAELCITRQIVTAIKGATRHKHQPLNKALSISAFADDREGDDGRSAEELLGADRDPEPLDRIVDREQMESALVLVAGLLSGFERAVLGGFIDGRSYSDIGAELGRPPKAIDNALQRIKRKLDGPLREARRAEFAAPSLTAA